MKAARTVTIAAAAAGIATAIGGCGGATHTVTSVVPGPTRTLQAKAQHRRRHAHNKIIVVPAPAAPVAPAPAPVVTDPWAVVSAYYGDVESQNYAEAWQLLDAGLPTGQTYQEFVDGYACTGATYVTKNYESGSQVNFSLSAVDTCTGATQQYSGTDTVENGKIVAANVTQTG